MMNVVFIGRVLRHHASLCSRIVAALFGGYALAALSSLAALALPMTWSEAAFTGLMFSFWMYTVAVIWVFAVRSAARAWAGLLVAALVLAVPAGWAAWSAAGVSA